MVDDIDDYSCVHTDVGNGVGKWYGATMIFGDCDDAYESLRADICCVC